MLLPSLALKLQLYCTLEQWLILFQGGMSFVAVKGVIRIYYKQQQYVRQAQRVVKDYDQE